MVFSNARSKQGRGENRARKKRETGGQQVNVCQSHLDYPWTSITSSQYQNGHLSALIRIDKKLSTSKKDC